MRLLPLTLLLIVSRAFSAEWFAATDGSGNGSFSSPWHLAEALTHASIQPGDTLYLRGGTYYGPFTCTLEGTAENYITIRSYTNEWAVIKDPVNGVLLADLSDVDVVVHNIPVANSEFWPSYVDGLAGAETLRFYNKSGTNWSVERGWNDSTITPHANGDAVKPKMDFLNHQGSYVVFRDFEITSYLSTNRVVGTTNALGAGLNFVGGVGNKAVNLIIHNVGHPGIGFWRQRDGGEINGCILYGNGYYDNDGAWDRGGGIYAQNDTGTVLIKNNIFFRNLRAGCSMYGTTASIAGFRFLNNISLYPGASDAESSHIMATVTPMTNNLIGSNLILGSFVVGYLALSNVDQHVYGNVMVGANFHVKQIMSGSVSNNLFLLRPRTSEVVSFIADTLNRSELDYVWDNNTYYLSDNLGDAFVYRSQDVQPATRLAFSDWQSNSAWDTQSTLTTNWPTDYLNVTVSGSDYDSNRWHVGVINTTAATTASLNLAAIGVTTTDSWQLRDAQNYFSVIASGVGNDEISLPLTLTNVAEIPGVTNFVNKHTNVDDPGLFNAFVLTRNPARERKASLGTATIGAGSIR